MIRVTGGILLPESILAQPWFHTFALFVAFNTIVYLGLTLSKLVPWPAQIHPDRVRVILPSVQSKDTTMKDIPRAEVTDPRGAFAQRRLETAAQSIPLALSLVAGVVIVILTIILVFISSEIDPLQVAIYAVAVVMLIWAQVCAHAGIPPLVIAWSWTVLMLALIVLISIFGIMFDNEIAMTYAVMLFVILPGITMLWSASLIGGAIGLVILTTAGLIVNRIDSVQWSIAALAAFGIGVVALQVRRSSVDRLLLEEMKCQLLATTDPLTRAMTRSALQVLAPTVLESAAAARQPVHLVMVDVAGMGRLNADYGTSYGDAVIVAVCQALQVAAPDPDLVARWDGDRFVALGVGPGPSASQAEAAIAADLDRRGIALGKRPVVLRVTCVDGDPAELTLDDLAVRAADALPASVVVPAPSQRQDAD